jgi:hypothetical protein
MTLFFTGRKLIVLVTSLKGSTFNELYFLDYIFPIWKGKREFSWSDPACNFWVHMDNSMYHNWSKGAQNSRDILFHDDRTHVIRQTYALATFGSLEHWRESRKITSLTRVMKLKDRPSRLCYQNPITKNHREPDSGCREDEIAFWSQICYCCWKWGEVARCQDKEEFRLLLSFDNFAPCRQ